MNVPAFTKVNDYNAEAWAYGHAQEKRVMNYLANTYRCKIRKSSKDEDIFDDIDCWMGDTSISIKSQDIALKTGNFGFELEMQDARTGEWKPAWYQTGKAKYYVIVVGDTYYQVSKERLVDYVEQHGWDAVKTLSPRIRNTQKGKRHNDYKNGLLSIKTALKHNIARII